MMLTSIEGHISLGPFNLGHLYKFLEQRGVSKETTIFVSDPTNFCEAEKQRVVGRRIAEAGADRGRRSWSE